MKAINEHPHMILREKDFSCIKINWNDKAQNLKVISEELNIECPYAFVVAVIDTKNNGKIKNIPNLLFIKIYYFPINIL